MGVVGWLAATCVTGGLAILTFDVLELDHLVLLAAGIALFGLALYLRRVLLPRMIERPSKMALVQFALAIGMCGQMLAVGGAAELGDAGAPWTAFAMAIIAGWLYPDAAQRFLSPVIAGFALVAALRAHELTGGSSLAAVLGTLILPFFLRPTKSHNPLGDAQLPVGLGLAAMSLAMLLWSSFLPHQHGAPEDAAALLGAHQPRLLTLHLAGLTLLLLWRIRGLIPPDRRPAPDVQLICATALAALAAFTSSVPGITAAIGLLILARVRRSSALTVMATLFLFTFLLLFYYDLQLTLLDKAAICATAGLCLVGAWLYLRWRQRRSDTPSRSRQASERRRWVGGLATTGLLLTLVTVNTIVGAKEKLLREGATVLLELAPQDPRALLQGDYMQLRYRIAEDVWRAVQSDDLAASGALVLSVEPQGNIGRFIGLDDKAHDLESTAVRIRYRLGRKHELSLCGNTFFFEEGDAARYEVARYAELRVGETGDCILVGLKNAKLQRLGKQLETNRPVDSKLASQRKRGTDPR
jgi:uncharacterized membrane-anchored protein